MVTVEQAAASGKRPRNRKAQIAGAAAAQFRELGYHRVGIEDIASAVGITGRAIYRHFDTKQDLLAHVVIQGVEQLEASCAAGTTLADTVAGLASVSVEHRDLGVLLQREARHLVPPERATVGKRIDVVAGRLARLLIADRPGLTEDEARFLVRGGLAVLASPSHHSVSLPSGAAQGLLTAMAQAALQAPVRPGAEPRRDASIERASRRESVLAAAIELFGRRGYGAVRMEDVGAAAGITGPSIYEHFAGKADLLMAALTRGAEWLQLGLTGALVPGAAPRTSLERVVRSYVAFTLEHTELMRVLLREAINLPDTERTALRRVQHEYVAEWVRLLAATRPELSDAEAWFITHAGLSVINDTVEDSLQYDLVEVSLAVLVGDNR
jgi:AcrR family transcriptional regulator